ncbi:MAG TPA: serine hydrolase, partial [Bacteroidales bacterium]|nr:serine hydrolase [Bacteroidales bacterium]
MLLKSDGRLDFDDKVADYIPELPYPGVRISHLLHHTGGLPNYMYLIDKYWSKNYPPDTEDVIAMLERYRLPAFFKPGSRYDYSNTGYVVLAALVERITGMSLNEFLQRRVFIPLGMKNTYVYRSADSNLVKRHIDGFRALKSGYLRIQESKSNGPVGDKGVCSTLEDLYIWDQA